MKAKTFMEAALIVLTVTLLIGCLTFFIGGAYCSFPSHKMNTSSVCYDPGYDMASRCARSSYDPACYVSWGRK